MKEYRIKNLAEYVKLTCTIRTQWFDDEYLLCPWFRGQEDTSWKLKPKLYRWEQPGDLEIESEVREEFCIRAPALSDYVKPSTDSSLGDWEWYFIMQHYGAPTRLIDWTESSLMALYFAVRSGKEEIAAAVWIIDPWELNEKVIHRDEVLAPADAGTLSSDRKKLKKWLPSRFDRKAKIPKYPIAIFPTHTMRRISAQRSCFTIHGSMQDGLENFLKRDDTLVKIEIPKNKIREIRRDLETCGIDETTIFPDLEALARAVEHSWKT